MDCRAIRFDCTYVADCREYVDELRALSFGSTRPLYRVPRRTTAEIRILDACEDRLNHFSPRSLDDLQIERDRFYSHVELFCFTRRGKHGVGGRIRRRW